MTIRWYGHPGRVAQAMITALEEDRLQTAGEWQNFIDHLQALPPRLQTWTLDRIHEISGDEAAEYLRSRMRPIVPLTQTNQMGAA